jgi:putative DNA primase/helicase
MNKNSHADGGKSGGPKAQATDAAAQAEAAARQAGAECLQAAIRYLGYGWAPLPNCPPDHVGIDRVSKGHRKDCETPGKRPWIIWRRYSKELPTEDEVRRWWRQLPFSNVGVALGPVSGLLRVDVDGQAGEQALRELSGGDLPDTLEFTSGREDGSGRGLLYKIPPGVTLKTTPKPKGLELGKGELRLQGEGAQTVLPPSRHESGRRYRWVEGHAPGQIEAAPAPPWLVGLMRADGGAAPGTGKRADPGAGAPAGNGAPGAQAEGGPSIIDRAVAHLLQAPPAVSGDKGHSQTFKVAREVVWGFNLGEKVGFDLMAEHYNPRCQPPWSEKELRHKCNDADTKPFDRPRGWLLAAAPGDDTNDTPEDVQVQEAVNDPHRLARLVRADHTTDGNGLACWREEWHRWDGRAYRPVPDLEMRGVACQRIKKEFDQCNLQDLAAWRAAGGRDAKGQETPPPVALKVPGRLVSDVLGALAGLALLSGVLEAPAWLGVEGPFPADEVLACRNTLVHLPSWADGKPHLHPLTPRFFSPNALDYDFLPAGPPPREWLGFLKMLWPHDPESVTVLQDWFGYVLLPDTRQHKILMMVSPPRGGKGTIARVLRAAVGARNVCAPTLSSLGTNFGLQPLLGKTLAVISDARLSGRSDIVQVVERLLSISGEDAQTVDRKNLPAVTTKLSARFMVMTNELPKVTDASGALVDRFVILRQTQSWLGKEDTELTAKLLGELPGILMWALEGYQRLRQRGCFLQPASASCMVQELRDLASPVGAFVRESCVVEAGAEVLVKELFDRWKAWCDEKGRKEPGTEQSFGRDLRAAVPWLDTRQPRVKGSGRPRYYVGIRLKGPGDDPDDPDKELHVPF